MKQLWREGKKKSISLFQHTLKQKLDLGNYKATLFTLSPTWIQLKGGYFDSK